MTRLEIKAACLEEDEDLIAGLVDLIENERSVRLHFCTVFMAAKNIDCTRHSFETLKGDVRLSRLRFREVGKIDVRQMFAGLARTKSLEVFEIFDLIGTTVERASIVVDTEKELATSLSSNWSLEKVLVLG